MNLKKIKALKKMLEKYIFVLENENKILENNLNININNKISINY